MSTTAERKFINLRKRLDQLGYRQPLGIESLPLVEKLFSDLVHTTESLRSAKLSAGKTEKESKNVDAQLEPYRVENARLVRENNELHLGLLKLREEKEKLSRELRGYNRKLEQEMSDLKFLNNQYVHKVQSLEKDCKAKMERIQHLQEKNLQAVVQTPGGKKCSIPFRRQRMQIDDLIPPSSGPSLPVAQPDDPYIADLLQVADDRIQELQQDVTRLKVELDRAQAGIQYLNTQVEERDGEIERLNGALSGGRPHDVISLEAQNISNEKLISHLNLQVEYLQETNRELEQKLQEQQQSRSDLADMNSRNQELCQELSHIEQLAQQLERDRELLLDTADKELLEAKNEIQRQHREKEEFEDVVSKLRRDLEESEYQKEELRVQLTTVKAQEEALREELAGLRGQEERTQDVVNFLEDKKRQLQEKVERLTGTEKELVLELERMRARYGVCGADRSPSRLDAFIRTLEEERDFYRQEAERLWSPAHSPTRGRSLTRGHSPRQSRQGRMRGCEAELHRALRERDELQAVLLGFERHMEDIQSKVKELTAERDTLSALHQRAQEELLQVHSGVELLPGVQQQLGEERKRAESDLRRMTAERDALLSQLKVIQSSAQSDREEDERKILDLETFIQTLQRERVELEAQVSALKESQVTVETEMKAQSATLIQTKEEATQQRAETSALRLLQEQVEQSLSDCQHRLSVKTDELHAAHAQIQKLEEQIGELSRREQVTALQKTLTFLDREKDALQDAVDQKTERIVVLQDELASKEKTLAAVRQTVTDMDNSLQHLQGALNSREREVASLRRQLDSVQEELADVGRDREIALRENRRLQDDLATMTRENQAVHAEMEEVLHEKDDLKLRVQSYISEVARIESLMAAKEQENRDVLERFRAAHSRAEDWELKLQQAEGLNSSIRLELLAADTERRHLRERVSNLEREIQEHMSAQQAYEAQGSSLVRSLSRLEEEVQLAHAERASALADLTSLRELCVKLDSGKEMTSRQLTSKSMELERVLGELEDVKSEAELVKKQLSNERLTVRNLETLLSSNRQKEFQTHLSTSEKESELKVLRDRLALADSKAATQTREVSQLRGKVSQLQTELDVLKRQLTAERFERSSSPLSSSLSPCPHSPERSILRTPEHSTDKSPEKSVSFKE
ncbi:centrosomal protein of 135 kDa isoform X2 [Megalops cyprinoides]|uniref:centrosomal protein of 135 kDa isoform X2 n=1 Tax=Megalops cyprinoides TaxID=118141 RepID=UPI00186472B0|nr:centrosomal protein of 135 kDa isoform X2 [Megalops cyprinoides]